MDSKNERNEMIHSKGFDIFSSNADYRYQENFENDYKKIKVGVKNLDDAVLNLGSFRRGLVNCKYTDKSYILRMMAENNLPELRNISSFFYDTYGIYERVCNYFAFLYRYDWYLMADMEEGKPVNKPNKILEDFNKILNFLDNSYLKKLCGDIALEVVKVGAYYGYIVPSKDGLVLQQLPVGYCRSRYNVGNLPAIEFDMSFFDQFTDPAYRMRVLNLFPDEFRKGYGLYLQGKLTPDYVGDVRGSWYLLEPENTIKFNFNNSDIPMFVNAIPALLDLDAAQDLDRRKQMQQLLKIVIQKLPLDKNGDLIFDIDEARDIHNNAVQMLSRAIGVDVLTTFADIESIDMSDKNTSTTRDDLEKVERALFNALGISQNLFNTDGNMSLEKSILNDESSMRGLLIQFNMFFNRITKALSNNKKYTFRFQMLETTQYNYKELAKLYKEQTQLGFSKLLPQIALGQSQSFILNSIKFENEILKLSEVMIPPLMSSTMSSADVLGKKNQDNNNKTQDKSEPEKSQIPVEQKSAGRPEKPDDQKSDKTIQNKESMS